MSQEIDIDTLTVMPESLDLSNLENAIEVISFDDHGEPLTDNPAIVEESDRFSNFGDEVCGEPMMAQHVVLNFVPNDEDREMSEKCCAFWKFVREHPELKKIMVNAVPMRNVTEPIRTTTTTTTSSSSGSSSTLKQPHVTKKSAVDILGTVEEKGFIDQIFEAKLPARNCEPTETYEPHEIEPLLPKQDFKNKKFVYPKCPKKTSFNACPCDMEMSHKLPPAPSCPKAVALCNVLENWDQQHPKSLEPPGHPPRLSHSIMQRKIIR